MGAKRAIITVVAGIWAMSCSPLWADNAQLRSLLEILHKKGTLTEEEYQLLRGAADAPPSEPVETQGKSETPTPPPPTKRVPSDAGVEVTTQGGLKVKSRDKAFEFKLGGRIQADSGFYQDDRVDHADGTELRRARLDLGGRIEKDWKFKMAYDFADNAVEDKSAYITYEGWPLATIKAGLYAQPFTLSEAISSLDSTFMEEAMLVSAFKTDDRIGVGLESGGEVWSLQAGLFGEGPSPNGAKGQEEANGAALRLTWAPALGKESLLHLGAGVVYQTTESNSKNKVSFNARPEAHVGTQKMVKTGDISNVDDWTSYGLEWAAGRGPVSVEGEYVMTKVDRDGDFPNLKFSGYYGSVSWRVTGESRPYEAESGSFGRIKPKENFSLEKGGWGAWEVAARYSNLDLTDNDVNGGEENNVTLGLNWYLNPSLRLMANYVLADFKKSGQHDEPKLFVTRIQVDF